LAWGTIEVVNRRVGTLANDGKPRVWVAGGEWRMANGEWRVVGGGWRVAG
jgi:hypothetical protein